MCLSPVCLCDQVQMVLPLDVSHLVVSSLSVPEHNQQLLEIITGGAAIVIPAWEPTAGGEAGQQAATDAVLGKLAFAWCIMCDMAPTYRCSIWCRMSDVEKLKQQQHQSASCYQEGLSYILLTTKFMLNFCCQETTVLHLSVILQCCLCSTSVKAQY